MCTAFSKAANVLLPAIIEVCSFLFMILTFLVRSRRVLFRHSRGKNPRARTAKIRLSPVKSLNHINGKAFHTGLAVLFRGCILQLFSVRFRLSPFVRHLSAVAPILSSFMMREIGAFASAARFGFPGGSKVYRPAGVDLF
ncbi:MAG: hypothetical protein IJU52_05760, partial [Clostridia bacterium]|nr:hypothetical protein [Clostridia bacterium]